MNFIFELISKIIDTIILNLYKHNISLKEEKIRELKYELEIEIEDYRKVLCDVRKWASTDKRRKSF